MRLLGTPQAVKRMMLAIAVIGLDLALMRGALQTDESEPCTSNLFLPTLIFVPPLSVLAVAVMKAIQGITRRGWTSPFATGYLLVGGLTSLVVSLDFATGLRQLYHLQTLVEGVLNPLTAPGMPEILLTSPIESAQDWWVNLLLTIAMCSIPQFVFAMIGGVLASRYGLAIVLRG